MAIEKVRDFFGIKYLIPYNLTTKKPLMVLRAVGEISFENAVEAVKLVGGHADAPYDVEYGQPEPSITGTVREYPAELFQIMETCTVTENVAEAAGDIGTLANGQGTSVYGAVNGISTVTASSAANLVFGQYVLVATGAQTLDLHINGLSDAFLDIDAQVVASISTTTAGSVAIAAAGITLTVAGTPAYTIGDTMYFDVRPINTGSTEILVGTGTVPTNFGVRCIFPRKTDGVLHYIDVFNVAARGMSWKGVSREFSEFEINWSPVARASDGAVYQMVRVLGS
jgi:hypothetical protein